MSKGTYIRTLGEDMGEALGCGAHLVALRRTRAGQFVQNQCVTLAALEAMSEAARAALLLPVDALLSEHVRVELDAANAARFLSGLRRRGDWPNAENVAVYGPQGDLLGSAHIVANELIPTRLLSPVEVAQMAAQAAQQTTTQQGPALTAFAHQTFRFDEPNGANGAKGHHLTMQNEDLTP